MRTLCSCLFAVALATSACSKPAADSKAAADPECEGAKKDDKGKCHNPKGQFVKDACCK